MEELSKHGKKGLAAMKAGLEHKTAVKYVAAGELPSELTAPRSWRTREDPSGRTGRRSKSYSPRPTANAGFTHWKHLFLSESSAIATVDRLVDRATILRFTGKSFRDPKEVVGAPLDD